MIYELRIYDAVPGKLPALNTRFRDHTTALFAKHGIDTVGFWTTYVGPSNHRLYYILAWDDMGQRQQRWDAFISDPEWIAAKAESEVDGVLVERVQSIMMKATDYSPMQ